MLLLNVKSWQLEKFIEKVPSYAILSHVWGEVEEEVTFDDLKGFKYSDKKGYAKIKSACEETQKKNLDYIWIDTCCIDKSSSAELSESINSMFQWYREAHICFTFLADVSSFDDPERDDSEFSKSRWFTRGWTLQELIAPRDVLFMSQDWKEIGTRKTLSPQISRKTGIDEVYLRGEANLATASVAHRMSWAAQRETTRPEDIAYCLLGIFDVNMPLIYGEGRKAFRRLQEEILRSSPDDSIFAWWREDEHSMAWDKAIEPTACGLLAESPADFAHSGGLIYWPNGHSLFEIRNYGIEFSSRHGIHHPGVVFLQCKDCTDYSSYLGIPILERVINQWSSQYFRAGPRIVRFSAARCSISDKPKHMSQTGVMRNSNLGLTPPGPALTLVMVDQPRPTPQQTIPFEVLIQPSKDFTIGPLTGENFEWNSKIQSLKRKDSAEPCIVRIPLRLSPACVAALWIACLSRSDFKLDYAMITPIEEFLEPDLIPNEPGRYSGLRNVNRILETDRSVQRRMSSRLQNSFRDGIGKILVGDVLEEPSPTGDTIYVVSIRENTGG